MFNSGQSLWYFTVVTIVHLFGVSTPKYVEDITAFSALLVSDFWFALVSRFQI
jgi:hypothetical protein